MQTWVTAFFAPVFVRRTTPMFKWCAQWWRHPEAVLRLEALWRSWEVLRLDPGTGAGVWLREYLDVQLASLTASAGPFADCDPIRHHEAPATLPLKAPPAGWFPAPSP